MDSQATKPKINLHLVKQSIKWTVYVLLLINFYFYLAEDLHRATHSLESSAPLIKWMQEYSTSIDYLAWLVLIAIFELDTYILEEHHFTPVIQRITEVIRVLCYLFVMHTIYAYSVEVYKNYHEVEHAAGLSSLCDVADDKISYVSNLRYTYLTLDNCKELGRGPDFYYLDKGMVVTDRINLQGERTLAWIDLLEVCCWFLIMIMIELNIRTQDRGISEGAVLVAGNHLKLACYTTILGLGVYWAFVDHVLYFWDEILWIGGFAAIEMNVADWRDELREQASSS